MALSCRYPLSIYSLLLVLILFASCNGQVKTNLPAGSSREPRAITAGQAKIIKTHVAAENTSAAWNVHCGLQDKAGNLWFGTTGEGVYRYDGKSFTQFTTKDGLSSNTVWSILEDKAGNIWLGTGDGICRYDPLAAPGGSEVFTRIPITVTDGSNFDPHDPLKNDPFTENPVWSMLQDERGYIWFGTREGAYRYDGRSFTYLLHADGVINNSGVHLKSVQAILEDKSGNIWFGSGLGEGEGVCRFDGKSITSFKPDGAAWVKPLLEDKAGNIWFGSNIHTVSRFDGKTFTSFAEKEILDRVYSMTEDKAGHLWFASENGLWRFDGRAFTRFTTKDGLSSNSVFCIVEDRAGNIWAGTRKTGLCRYDGKTFTNFSD